MPQPFPEEIVSDGGALFHVVHDEMGVSSQQVLAAQGQRPQVVEEDLQLEGEVQQVVSQAVFAKSRGAILSLVVDALLTFLPAPGRLEPFPELGVREPNHRGFAEVVQDLGV